MGREMRSSRPDTAPASSAQQGRQAAGGRGPRGAGPGDSYITNLCKRRGTVRAAGAGPGWCQAAAGQGKMAAVEAETAPLTLESLPTDPLLLILSFVDYRDLIK